MCVGFVSWAFGKRPRNHIPFGAWSGHDCAEEVPQAPKMHQKPTIRMPGGLIWHGQWLATPKKVCLFIYPDIYNTYIYIHIYIYTYTHVYTYFIFIYKEKLGPDDSMNEYLRSIEYMHEYLRSI